MSVKRIVPIVEGEGEKLAVPKLLYRQLKLLERTDVHVAEPYQLKRTKLTRDGELERAIKIAERTRRGCAAFLVIEDADDDCPAELGAELLQRASSATGLPVGVVLPKYEYEAWFLGSLESLRGRASIPQTAQTVQHPENVRGAKERLMAVMGRKYRERSDQAELSRHFDMEMAYQNCRSFRKFVKEAERLLTTIEA